MIRPSHGNVRVHLNALYLSFFKYIHKFRDFLSNYISYRLWLPFWVPEKQRTILLCTSETTACLVNYWWFPGIDFRRHRRMHYRSDQDLRRSLVPGLEPPVHFPRTCFNAAVVATALPLIRLGAPGKCVQSEYLYWYVSSTYSAIPSYYEGPFRRCAQK